MDRWCGGQIGGVADGPVVWRMDRSADGGCGGWIGLQMEDVADRSVCGWRMWWNWWCSMLIPILNDTLLSVSFLQSKVLTTLQRRWLLVTLPCFSDSHHLLTPTFSKYHVENEGVSINI